MRIPKGKRPSAAAPKGSERDHTKENLCDPRLVWDGAQAWILATNGHAGVAIKAVDATPDDLDGSLPYEAVIAAEKGLRWPGKDDEGWHPEITAGPSDCIVRLSETDTLLAKRPEQLFPDVLRHVRACAAGPGVATLTLDVTLLRRVAQALGTDRLTLTIHDTDGWKMVTAIPWSDSTGDALGVIATVRPDGTKPESDAPDTATGSLLDEEGDGQ